MPKKPIADVAYETISHYDWDEQEAERERRFRPRVDALGYAGTETLAELLDYIVSYKRANRNEEMSRYAIAARASFNALCRFMGVPIGKYEIADHVNCNSERAEFWQWCWEISEKRRLETAWQGRLEL